MMIKLFDGSYVNSNRVWRIAKAPAFASPKAQSILTADDGRELPAVVFPDVLVAAINSTIIPAAPGYVAIKAIHGGVSREAIIAWRFNGPDTIPDPITAGGLSEDVAILGSDGTVCVQGFCTFANEQAWMEEAREGLRPGGLKTA